MQKKRHTLQNLPASGREAEDGGMRAGRHEAGRDSLDASKYCIWKGRCTGAVLSTEPKLDGRVVGDHLKTTIKALCRHSRLRMLCSRKIGEQLRQINCVPVSKSYK